MTSELKLRGWRKFGIAAGVLVMGFIALMVGNLTGDNFVTLALGDIGLYGAANVGTQFAVKNGG